MPFRLLDLPAELRMHIYCYALGMRVIHIYYPPKTSERPEEPCRHHICINSPTSFSSQVEYAVAERWNEGTMEAVPYCGFHFAHSDRSLPRLNSGFLRSCRQVYQEAKDIIMQHNIFTFTNGQTFDDFIVRSPMTLLRAQNLTKLAIVTFPKSDSLHYFNRAIYELYNDQGWQGTPFRPRFRTLKTFQFCVRTTSWTSMQMSQDEKWTDLCWIWSFWLFAIERLEEVSVVSSEYVVRQRLPGGRWPFELRPTHQEQVEYEEVVRSVILRNWRLEYEREMIDLEKEYHRRMEGKRWIERD